MDDQQLNRWTEQIIGAGIEIHRQLGPGLLESAYEECLDYELRRLKLAFTRQQSLPVIYKGVHLDCGYRMDMVIENAIILELKTVDALLPIHDDQLLTYLKLSDLSLGLLFNFNVPVFKQGVRRIVNHYEGGTLRARRETADGWTRRNNSIF